MLPLFLLNQQESLEDRILAKEINCNPPLFYSSSSASN